MVVVEVCFFDLAGGWHECLGGEFGDGVVDAGLGVVAYEGPPCCVNGFFLVVGDFFVVCGVGVAYEVGEFFFGHSHSPHSSRVVWVSVYPVKRSTLSWLRKMSSMLS